MIIHRGTHTPRLQSPIKATTSAAITIAASMTTATVIVAVVVVGREGRTPLVPILFRTIITTITLVSHFWTVVPHGILCSETGPGSLVSIKGAFLSFLIIIIHIFFIFTFLILFLILILNLSHLLFLLHLLLPLLLHLLHLLLSLPLLLLLLGEELLTVLVIFSHLVGGDRAGRPYFILDPLYLPVQRTATRRMHQNRA